MLPYARQFALSLLHGRPTLVVRLGLGTFLLVAAGLKVHGLALDPLAQDSLFGSTRLQVAIVELEIVLGLWLLSGWSPRASWLLALAFFGVMASASLYMALVGQRSCGCFGRVSVSPWWTLALDLALLAALAFCRPRAGAHLRFGTRMQAPLTIGTGASAILALTGAVFLLVVPDPTLALAWLRGDSVIVDGTDRRWARVSG